MIRHLKNLSHSLFFKLLLMVGLTLILSVFVLSYVVVGNHREKVMLDLVRQADRLSTTIKLGTHYAMMLNSRDDIRHIIMNVSRQKEIENIRIYNKAGKITFTNHKPEAGRITNIKAEACDVCHRTDPPQASVPLSERTRIFASGKGYRCLGILSPIYNEP
ncbi:MAG: PAS domain-containing sensor histidine kinase, partial [Thermodesulfobacteriota bacterium]